MQFRDRVVWITGASSGIGAALAKALASRGAELILSGRRMDALEAVKASCLELGRIDILLLPFEATDFEALPAIVVKAQQWKGHIDVLINNAGVSQRSLVVDSDMSVYRRIIDIDYFSPVMLTKLVLPGMIAQGGGLIAVTSSLAGKIGSKMRSGYCSAKHALHGFYDSLRAEVYADNIRVSIILPGYVQSNVSLYALTGDGGTHGVMDAGQAGAISADAAAARILRQLEKEREEIYVGTGAEMLAPWLKRFFPGLLSRFLRKQKVPGGAGTP